MGNIGDRFKYGYTSIMGKTKEASTRLNLSTRGGKIAGISGCSIKDIHNYAHAKSSDLESKDKVLLEGDRNISSSFNQERFEQVKKKKPEENLSDISKGYQILYEKN